MPNASRAALQVIQEAIGILASWANTTFPHPHTQQSAAEEQPFVQAAKDILKWSQDKPAALQIVFDRIHLTHEATNSPAYRPAWALEVKRHKEVEGYEQTPRIPYPQNQKPTEAEFEELKNKIKNEITQLNPDNLAQLTLFLEKFGSHLSIGESDIALIDQTRSTAALAAALASYPPNLSLTNQPLALIAGDLTGVQKFIYTISSDGALKSLRARSFYLELATEEIVYQLLDTLKLPRTNIIYAGASKFYILAAATDATKQVVKQIQKRFNQWLLNEFQRKVFLAMDLVEFPASDLKPQTETQASDTLLSKHWRNVSHKLSDQSSRKFQQQIRDVLTIHTSHTPCKVCHRDDKEKLRRLSNEADSVEACPTCRRMFRLGGQLLKVEAMVRSPKRPLSEKYLGFNLPSGIIFYSLFDTVNEALSAASSNLTLLVNTWDISQYKTRNTAPLLLGTYGQKSSIEPGATMSAREMVEVAKGIQRVGYLRMDVDRLSQIFAKGLRGNQTLPRLASLSRQMTYFFKVYLNSLAEKRQENLPSNSCQLNRNDNRPNLLFIYAGGDDLFVSGAWDEVVDFAFDVYQSFRAYTGNHPDITLSAGVYLADAKFPLYQAAARAGDMEDDAKDNDRDSLAFFGEVFKWEEWLGKREGEPALFGVLPLVKELLKQELDANTSQAFVRNLLVAAQKQNQMIQARKEQIERIRKQQPQLSDEDELIKLLKQEQKEIRSYLHLPRVAYTIARLPSRVRDSDDFKPIRTSLKHTKNAPYFRAVATWIELLTRKS